MSDLYSYELQVIVNVDHEELDYVETPHLRLESSIINALEEIDCVAPCIVNAVECEQRDDIMSRVDDMLDGEAADVDDVKEAFKHVPNSAIGENDE